MYELERGFLNKIFNVYTAIKNPSVKGQQFVKVGDCSIMVVVSQSSDLASRDVITLEDLIGIPLFVPGRESPYFKAINKAFNTAGITPTFAFYGRLEDSINLISANMGAGLFQFIVGADIHLDGFKTIDLEPCVSFEYGLGYRDNLSAGEQAFVQHIRDYADLRLNSLK